MIKTLRITSIIAAILAGVFFVFPVVYGVRSDESVDNFLKLPGVRDKFESASDKKSKKGENRVSPLVEQAEVFALFLNPIKPAVRKTVKGGKTPNISSKLAVTPKFKVYATSYFPENPQLSQALIEEPGKGRHWVLQSSNIGHLLLEQVKDGIVVIKGGKETYELEIELESQSGTTSRLTSTSSLKTSRSSVKPVSSKPATAFSRASTNVRRARTVPSGTSRSNDDEQKMGELVDKLKDLQKNPASNRTDSGVDTEERAARIEELISKFKSTRVSAEEAKKLGDMGEELKDSKENSKRPLSEAAKSKVIPPK